MTVYRFDGKTPTAAPSSWTAPTATLIGDVTLCDHASVWFNAVLRGDCDAITVGRCTNIQDLTMCHADYGVPLHIGDRVTVGHNCVIHGCRIEDDCLIGMGAVVMNKGVIGRGSIVAAGSVILDKTRIPPFSLVAGAPGVVKKQLDEKVIKAIQASADHYVLSSEEYRSGRLEKVE